MLQPFAPRSILRLGQQSGKCPAEESGGVVVFAGDQFAVHQDIVGGGTGISDGTQRRDACSVDFDVPAGKRLPALAVVDSRGTLPRRTDRPTAVQQAFVVHARPRQHRDAVTEGSHVFVLSGELVEKFVDGGFDLPVSVIDAVLIRAFERAATLRSDKSTAACGWSSTTLPSFWPDWTQARFRRTISCSSDVSAPLDPVNRFCVSGAAPTHFGSCLTHG